MEKSKFYSLSDDMQDIVRSRSLEETGEDGYDPHDRTARCSLGCGGKMHWCSSCATWTNDCCVNYGTCMCS